MAENNKEHKLDIALSEQVAAGVYSNLQIVQHSPTEFIVDFVQIMPNVPKAQVKSRIILNPVHAKKLLHALQENLTRYEMTFGQIKEETVPNVPYTEINPMGKA
ncbi:MAG: DUF3467 domain-containing protein [Bacteroidales bacterium]|nr:DUF3467 domain-containing protein [Bacteroidales bacterium]